MPESRHQQLVAAEMTDRWAFAAQNVTQPIAYITSDGYVVDANGAFFQAFPSDATEPEEISVRDLVSNHEQADSLIRAVRRALSEGPVAEDVSLGARNGTSTHTYRLTASRYDDPREGALGLVHLTDVTQERRNEERLQLYEFKDRRTGLPNRRSLEMALDKEMARVERSGGTEILAVLFISLENFARINQTYGHQIGDILLENSGLRIKETIISELLRDSDYVFAGGSDDPATTGLEEVAEPHLVDPDRLVFRFEGREFTVLLTGIERETDAAVVAMRIVRSVTMPYRDKFGSEIFINCNIGIAIYPNDGEDKETIIDHSASAMNEAKRLGEEFLLFNKALHKTALEKMRLGGSIYNAFIDSQFELHMQPIVDGTGTIIGAEALIRWRHPDRGIVPPNEFIPLAEEKGIIVNIGKWTLYNAVQMLSRWPKDCYVSVNLSPRELDNIQLVDNILRVLHNAPTVDASQLKIEITERDSMRNPEEAIRKMRALANRGIDILIDDFGTGQSSLQYLKELPATTLKIDRSFVMNIAESEDDRQFLESIVDLAHSRGKHVIIEGVETREQFEIIKRMKPVLFQGFYFSEPVPAVMFEEMLEKRVQLPAP